MSFWRTQSTSPAQLEHSPPEPPRVRELTLKKHYRFQYENFVIATQHQLFLMLAKEGENVSLLRFDRVTASSYGSPNDEARGGHPLMQHGLGFYGLFEVENSGWIYELMIRNRVHPSHKDSMFADRKHFVACFKDVMLEVVCDGYEEVQMQDSEVAELINAELGNLE